MIHHFTVLDGFLIAIPVIILVLVLLFEIKMFAHAVRNPRLNQQTKLIWLLGMLAIHPLVAVAYYFYEYHRA